MWQYIERIRKKPKPIRNLYAFWGAAIFTAIVVAIWSVSVPQRLLLVLQPQSEGPEASGRLWSGVVEYTSDLRANIIGAVKGDQEKTVQPTSTAADAYEIDLSAIARDTTTTPETSEGVWQRTYEPRSGGRTILIATTSTEASGTPRSE